VQAESVTSTPVYTYTSAGLRVAQSVDGDEATYAWDWASSLPEMLSEGGNLYLVGHETLGKWDGGLSLRDKLGSFGLRPKLHAVGWSQTKLQPCAKALFRNNVVCFKRFRSPNVCQTAKLFLNDY
jgi:hypothetical protein